MCAHVYALQPLPHFLANGRVRFFNVTCQTENAEVPKDHGSCRDLRSSSTSCSLHLPAGRCLCTLTTSTSAGTSPKAQIWLRGAADGGRASFTREPGSFSEFLQVESAAERDQSALNKELVGLSHTDLKVFPLPLFKQREAASWGSDYKRSGLQQFAGSQAVGSFKVCLFILHTVITMNILSNRISCLKGEKKRA